ncbi:UNVERIFIED_CONTAM: hypothetical protein Slati_2888400 [Sesamum latifolium]|uniref:Retrotransposon Copia-like N-terminal domain-containing protein n=1 Tax=Sesamum latifolium TaxID=2727402 RepID=A0AAW2VHI7_9LAMI
MALHVFSSFLFLHGTRAAGSKHSILLHLKMTGNWRVAFMETPGAPPTTTSSTSTTSIIDRSTRDSSNRTQQELSLHLLNSENPGMMLVSTPLTPQNYLAWSGSARIIIGAKMKLGFINGKAVRPSDDSPDLELWVKTDYLDKLRQSGRHRLFHKLEMPVGRTDVYEGYSSLCMWL